MVHYVWCVDHPKDRSKINCLVHCPVYSSDECKVFVDFGSKYSKSGPSKERWQDPVAEKNTIQQEKNAIVQHSVDEIILRENKN